jgi:hypothetical protein
MRVELSRVCVFFSELLRRIQLTKKETQNHQKAAPAGVFAWAFLRIAWGVFAWGLCLGISADFFKMSIEMLYASRNKPQRGEMCVPRKKLSKV